MNDIISTNLILFDTLTSLLIHFDTYPRLTVSATAPPLLQQRAYREDIPNWTLLLNNFIGVECQ